MKKNHLLPLFLFFTLGVNAQISLDSLKLELEKKYTSTKASNDWNAYTIKYLDGDSLTRFILSFDEEGQVEEDIWSIALSAYEYDSLGRGIERRYYGINGKLYFSDWPPIIRINYHQNGKKSAERYFDVDDKPLKKYAETQYDYDIYGNVIEERMVNDELLPMGARSIHRYEYKNDGKTVVDAFFNENGELFLDENHGYTETTYKTSKRDTVVELRYLDAKKEPTMVEDYGGRSHCAIRYTYGLKAGFKKAERLDTKNKVIDVTWEEIFN